MEQAEYNYPELSTDWLYERWQYHENWLKTDAGILYPKTHQVQIAFIKAELRRRGLLEAIITA
jgi:hypothetical protein